MIEPVDEDLLEHLFLSEKNGKQSVTREEIANALNLPLSELDDILLNLAGSNDIVLGKNADISLTQKGRRTGEKISRKHSVLECFLHEMLGMSMDTASKQACLIEHNTSDETIDRLDHYLSAGYRWCRHRKKSRQEEREYPSIGTFQEGDRILITVMNACPRTRRLMDIGILPGETIIIKRKLGANKSIVIEVKDIEICLSPEIASIITGEKVG
ncbi:MAG: metal-dependent transcriptional regulator [Methanospirillaceae archaeon]|nr:metal-dependent transcriptional regulator [Methanospirillaceae archaeon]